MDSRPATVALPPVLRAALGRFAAGEELLRCAPAVQNLKIGRTNQTWRVTGGAYDWAVRIGTGNDARLGIDRMAEAALLPGLAAAGFAPPLVTVQPERTLLVTEFITAPVPDRRLARTPAFARRLGARLRALHEIPVPGGTAVLDLAAVLAHYAELAPPASSPVRRPQVLALLRRHLLRYQPASVALCHLDVHRDNLLDGEPLLLVDWEYAAYSDPLLDLAAYVSYESLDEAAGAALLEGYGPAAAVEPRTLRRAGVLFDCLRALWVDAANAWDDVAQESRIDLCARLDAS